MEDKLKRTKILLVDDDPASIDFFNTILFNYGHLCEAAQNGKEGLEKAKKTHPDIILLDAKMPEMKEKGIEICKNFKEDPETLHVPIIVLTAYGDKEIMLRCLKAGANDFLTKPFDSIELIVRIENILKLTKFEEVNINNEIFLKTFKLIANAKKEWESTMDCVDNIVVLTDANDNIIRCNKILTTLTGKPYNKLLNRKWNDVFRENGFSRIINNSIEKEFFHKSGRWFVFNAYPVRNIEGKTGAIVLSFKDITDRKQAEEKLEKSKEILEQKNKELEKAYCKLKAAQSQILQQEKMASIGQLAAGVAHEINNPIGFIMSNLGTLQKYIERFSKFMQIQAEAIKELSNCENIDTILTRVEEQKRASKLDFITKDIVNLIKESLDGIERVKRIVQDLKGFSHIDEAEYRMANLNNGIESTINIVWNELKYKVTLKKEYGDIPMTSCNLGQLNQVFMNILVNAAHAIEKQGEVTVKTWSDEGNIYVSVADTGCGMPGDRINRIFEPFYTTKEVGKGTGLGLSIAYDIVKKHKGDIKVDSEVGKGTTFTIKIPIVEK